MQLIPAIDILGTRVVRLSQGDYQKVTDWNRDPLELARDYQAAGCRRLHLVDLAGARDAECRSAFRGLIRSLASSTDLEIQVGGGLRSLSDIRDLFDLGAHRAVVGTLLFSDPRSVRKAVLLFGPDRLVGAVDVRAGEARVRGWTEGTGIGVEKAIQMAEGLGVGEILMTAIERDGMDSGPDLALYRQVVGNLKRARLVASGGVRHETDLLRLKDLGCKGAIVGRALLSGQISPRSWSDISPDSAPNGASQLAVRIIPCLDVDQERVVKGTRFQQLRDAGDPASLAELYCREGADELVLLDITATAERRDNATEMASRVARSVNIPFTIGGGVRSAADALQLLRAGADKVAVNSAAVRRPRLLTEIAEELGSANTVCAVDVRQTAAGWTVLVAGGREDSGQDALEWVQEASRRGAGEILLTSFDRDGTGAGFDLELLAEVRRRISIPLIASGGGGSLESFVAAAKSGADALLAASVFHYQTLSVSAVKDALREASIKVRQ